jgi:probable rRNA maturation factor
MNATAAADMPDDVRIAAPHVEVIVEDDGWGDPSALVERAVVATLTHLALDPAVHEVSVLACDDDRIRVLNARFRGQDKPTNVLSWPAVDLAPDRPGEPPCPPDPGTADDPEPLGDIALALGVCRAEAAAEGKPFDHHLTHLVVHGVLHLLGHDHETDADAHLMEGHETAILAGLGIADPHAVEAETGLQGGRIR